MSIVHAIKCNECGKLFEQIDDKNGLGARKAAARAGWNVGIPRRFPYNDDGDATHRQMPTDKKAALDICETCTQASIRETQQRMRNDLDELFATARLNRALK